MTTTPHEDSLITSEIIRMIGEDTFPSTNVEEQLYEVKIPDQFDSTQFERKSGQPTIVEICGDEEAIDLWTFKYDKKDRSWDISGIYRTAILQRLEEQGYAKRFRPGFDTVLFIHGGPIINRVTDTVMRDSLKAYIEANPKLLEVKYLRATYEGRLETFLKQQHLTINPKGLEGLKTHERPLLRDTATVCYVPYANGIVEVTADGAAIKPYEILEDKCVWRRQVLDREFYPNANGSGSHFARFINNVSNHEPDRERAFRSAIGYLIHHYGNPAEGQAILCYDEEITDASKPEGGTGKGLFGNAIRQIRPVAVIDGKKFDQNDRFCFQEVDQDTAVVWIDDPMVNHAKADRRFTLERFFSALTEGWAIEKKHEHAFRIPAKEGPKLLISSNVVMPNEGSSNVRRQFIIEFSNYYKKHIQKGNEKPIQAEHGCNFFSEDWNAAEWQRFDQYMINCVVEYLRYGLQTYKLRSTGQNRLLQTAGEDFYMWVTRYEGTGLLCDQLYKREALWESYREFAGLPHGTPVTRGFTNNIISYASGMGWKYQRVGNNHTSEFALQSS